MLCQCGFGMSDDSVVPVSLSQSQEDGALPGLPDDCCAICFEQVDNGLVRNALACCHNQAARIKCPTCTAVYHRKCLEKFFLQPDNRLARERQCVRHCGTELLGPTYMQYFRQWCRKHLLALYALLVLDFVVISVAAQYSLSGTFGGSAFAAGVIVPMIAIGVNQLVRDLHSGIDLTDELTRDRKKALGLTIVGMTAISGILIAYSFL